MKKVSAFLLSSILTVGVGGEAGAVPCTTVIDDLIAYVQGTCSGNCENVVSYQMTVMNNDKFVGYSSGELEYKKEQKYFYTNSASTIFSDRVWPPCCPSCPPPPQGNQILCMDKQPFDYHRPEMLAFKILRPGILSLDFNSWNEHYAFNLSCQDGYMYGFKSGRFIVTLHLKKSTATLPPR